MKKNAQIRTEMFLHYKAIAINVTLSCIFQYVFAHSVIDTIQSDAMMHKEGFLFEASAVWVG